MKIYLIGLYYEKDEIHNVQSIIKATTSYYSAKQFILNSIEKFKNNKDIFDFECYESEQDYYWVMEYKLKGIDTKRNQCTMNYRIEEIELDDKEDVPDIQRPELEKRCESLEKHNDELKKEISELKKNNSAAQCYLTFYDGGIYEDREHIIANMYQAREILRGTEKGNDHILQLYENWSKHKCKECKCKK